MRKFTQEMQSDCDSSKATSGTVAVCTTGESDRSSVPLVVDLDGTLLRTDLLHESAVRLVKQKPWSLIAILLWLLRGRKFFKRRIFGEVGLDGMPLPINEEVYAWLAEEKSKGRLLILATASDRSLAEQTVKHLGLFDIVLGSLGERDLKGPEKVEAIKECCGTQFDYAGNSRADLAIWRVSRQAVLVNPTKAVESEARKTGNVSRVISSPKTGLKAGIKSLRLYQWVKNLLIFVPAFTSHEWANWHILTKCAIAFVAFSFCASATYIANDLIDLEEDRRNATKRLRPFASGECSILWGVIIATACMLAGFSLAFVAGNHLSEMLFLYIFFTACYSLEMKKVFLLDVMTLAVLYTMRVMVGHVVTGITFSMWLLSFAFFLFLSLAFSKRAAELINLGEGKQQTVPGRGYLAGDLQVITMAGICSGFLSSLVFALYVNSASVTLLYKRPAILWGILPLLLYYIVRVWIVCGRGELDVDPILYTAKSKSTYCIAAIVLLLVIAATVRF
jgi:4-hydroxybenzoate polyprenyltransferase